MKEKNQISKAKIKELQKLKQKKYRRLEKRVILEGKRLFSQLEDYGVFPLELYQASLRAFENEKHKNAYLISAKDLKLISDSETPPQMAGLFEIPLPRQADFQSAFYLDDISDPGNLGTIFRIAAAMGIGQIFLSGNSCDTSNPKLIRASLGAVYKVPFQVINLAYLSQIPAKKYSLDMDGAISLKDWQAPEEPCIYLFGSEAHGLSGEFKALAAGSLKIPMSGAMESLNIAITAGILAWHLS